MEVKTFTALSSEALDERINKFFESWANDTHCNYTFVDIRLCYQNNLFIATVVYNKNTYLHPTF